MKPKIKTALKLILYVVILLGIMYMLTFIPTNQLLIGLSGLQIAVLFFIRERLKKLESNQTDIVTMQNKSTEYLGENQSILHKEIKRINR